MHTTVSVTCSCGERTQSQSIDSHSAFVCPRCHRKLLLPRFEGLTARIHVVESDLGLWPVIGVGWSVALTWLALGYLAAGGPELAWVVVLLVFFLFFCYFAWTSDGFRLLTSVSDYRPLLFRGLLGYALALAVYLLAPAFSVWAWMAGLALFASGWRASLMTSRAPVRRTARTITGLPDSVGEMTVHVGAKTNMNAVRERLPDAVFLLRSFLDDRNTVEEYVWAAPVGQQGGIMAETLEKTLSFVATQKSLTLLKLGASSEASYAIETTDTEWQSHVAEISRKCRTIALVPGGTPGVVWEIEHLISHDELFHKALLVFPSEAPSAADSRWNDLRQTFAGRGRRLPALPQSRTWDPILIRFPGDASTEWFVARHHRWTNRMGRRTYLWSFSIALERSDT